MGAAATFAKQRRDPRSRWKDERHYLMQQLTGPYGAEQGRACVGRCGWKRGDVMMIILEGEA